MKKILPIVFITGVGFGITLLDVANGVHPIEFIIYIILLSVMVYLAFDNIIKTIKQRE